MNPKRKTRENERKDRGVSPIIATILLVAITVVLAAVLYALVIMPAPPAPPTVVGFGPDAPGACTTAGGGSLYTYAVTVASVSSSLSDTRLGLRVTNVSGAVVPIGLAGVASGNCPGVGSSGTLGGWIAVLESPQGAGEATLDQSGWSPLPGATIPAQVVAESTFVIVSAHPIGGDTLATYPFSGGGISGQEGL